MLNFWCTLFYKKLTIQRNEWVSVRGCVCDKRIVEDSNNILVISENAISLKVIRLVELVCGR